VQNGEGTVRRLRRHRIEDAARTGGRTGEQRVAAGSGQAGLEELTDDAEAERLLELAAASGEHAHRAGRSQPARLGEQPGLADARRALDEQQARLAGRQVVEGCPDHPHLAVAVEQIVRGRLRGGLGCGVFLRGAGPLGGDRERRRLREDLLLALPQCRPRVHAELVGERGARPAEGAQCIGLPVCPVEGEGEQPPPLLAQRRLGDHGLELGHEQRGLAESQPGREQPFPSHLPQPGEPGDLGLGPRLVGPFGQRRATPERQRIAEQPGGDARVGRAPGRVEQLLEPPDVDGVRGQPDRVPAALADDDRRPRAGRAARLEAAAQVRDVGLERS
jgi:hypothetical protein